MGPIQSLPYAKEMSYVVIVFLFYVCADKIVRLIKSIERKAKRERKRYALRVGVAVAILLVNCVMCAK